MGIEKQVDARGMTHDGASSPIAAFSSFGFHPVSFVSPQPRPRISAFFASRILLFKIMETARIALQT